MRVTTLRTALLTIVLLLGVVATGARSTAALAQDDATRFAELLAARDAMPAAGPIAGELVQNDALIATVGSGLSVADFSAAATFLNPLDPGVVPWDAGFVFHAGDESAQQVFIDSEGGWYYIRFPEGIEASGFAPQFDPAPGAANVIDLIVEGQTALLGLNGEYVTSLALPPSDPSDVRAGTGFLGRTTDPGRAIAYEDFQVWTLPADSSTTTTPGPDVALTDADIEAFANLLALQSDAAVIAGPFTANLKEEVGQASRAWAGVALADFHAHAEFMVPAASETPWDIGFTFRSTPEGPMFVTVDSLGNWYFSIGDEGPAEQGTVAGLDTTAGAMNALDLFVAERGAVIGVNGTLAAIIDLPVDTSAGDVAASTGIFSDQTLPDRITTFRDFTLRDFALETLPDETRSTQFAPEDVEEFAAYVVDTRSVTPPVGPFAGRLVETTPGLASLAPAGTSLADFGAVATFINPDDIATAPWDAGFQFRSDGDAMHRVVLLATGEVIVGLPDGTTTPAGFATGYDPAPGASNELQLFVAGDQALFGVNDALAAVVTLSGEPVSSDILVGTAFFEDDFVQGRVTGYEGFRVWPTA